MSVIVDSSESWRVGGTGTGTGTRVLWLTDDIGEGYGVELCCH